MFWRAVVVGALREQHVSNQAHLSPRNSRGDSFPSVATASVMSRAVRWEGGLSSGSLGTLFLGAWLLCCCLAWCVLRVSLASFLSWQFRRDGHAFCLGRGAAGMRRSACLRARHAADSERGRLAPRLTAAGEQDLKLK